VTRRATVPAQCAFAQSRGVVLCGTSVSTGALDKHMQLVYHAIGLTRDAGLLMILDGYTATAAAAAVLPQRVQQHQLGPLLLPGFKQVHCCFKDVRPAYLL
jgi:7-keto-8-aminopelargonate synthetase-like enzyme